MAVGRVDDVMNVEGHRISTTEVESAPVCHPDVTQAAAVVVASDETPGRRDDETTRQGIVAFMILRGSVIRSTVTEDSG